MLKKPVLKIRENIKKENTYMHGYFMNLVIRVFVREDFCHWFGVDIQRTFLTCCKHADFNRLNNSTSLILSYWMHSVPADCNTWIMLRQNVIITSARRSCFYFCLSVCLSVARISQKVLDRFPCSPVCDRFGHISRTNTLNFGWKFYKNLSVSLILRVADCFRYLILCKSLIYTNKLN